MTRDELKTILAIALPEKWQPEGVFLSTHPITGEKDRDGWDFFTSDDARAAPTA